MHAVHIHNTKYFSTADQIIKKVTNARTKSLRNVFMSAVNES
jgi:hypothetical protein